jgi:hypothetical protein
LPINRKTRSFVAFRSVNLKHPWRNRDIQGFCQTARRRRVTPIHSTAGAKSATSGPPLITLNVPDSPPDSPGLLRKKLDSKDGDVRFEALMALADLGPKSADRLSF